MSIEAVMAVVSEQSAGQGRRFAFLSLFSYFARDLVWRSPSRALRVLRRMAPNITRQFGLLYLLKVPAIARLAGSEPKFFFKYLQPDYLLRDIAVTTRTSCFLHHYRRLGSLPEALLHRILCDKIAVFELCDGGHCFAVTMGRSRPEGREGELSLYLEVDGDRAFTLSATIVPGWVVGSQAVEVLLITRLQGEVGASLPISLAINAMCDISPNALLLAALRGVGAAFDIPLIALIGGVDHLCYAPEFDSIFKKGYDLFSGEIGATRNPSGFYLLPIAFQEKPLSLIKPGHKLRTKRKRAFKRKIAEITRRIFREDCPREEEK